jgi:hypothetical protein
MSQSNEITTLYSKINPVHIYATDLEDNERSKGQKIAYPRFKDSDKPIMIQCEWFELNSYGIPGVNEFFKEDSQRLFIKVPLDQSNPKVKEFSDWLRNLDEHLNSESFKEKLFGNKKDKYQYQACFRLPQEEDEDDKKKNLNKKDYGPKQPYMKIKIDTSYPDNKIKSPIFKSVMENGVRVRTKVDNVNTIDDLQSHLCFLSKFRPIIRPVKFWAQAPNKKDPMYGLTFKMIKAEFEPRLKNNSNIQQFIESDIFLDEDVDEVQHVSPTASKAKPSAKNIVEVDSDDSESDDEQPIKVASKSKVIDSESDEDVVKPKQVMTVADSDSDEDVKPKKNITKKSSKTKKAVV